MLLRARIFASILFPMVLYDFTASSSFATAPTGSSFPMALCHVPASLRWCPGRSAVLPRRPGQQQTSSVGEKYSGLASNLAHLGRIC